MLNLGLFVAYAGFIWLVGYVEGWEIMPLVVAGGLAGLLSGVLELLSRATITQRLRDARTLPDVIFAYRFSPWGRFKSLITLAALACAWFAVTSQVTMFVLTKIAMLFSGFAVVDAGFRGALGIKLLRLEPSLQDAR